MDGSSALQEEWTAGVRAQWAAHRAAASAGGSDGGAWLDGDAAAAMACDAAMAPIVTGEVNPAALEDLIRLCVQLDKLRYPEPRAARTPTPAATPATAGTPGQGAPASDTRRAWEALEQAVIGKAVDLLSGPGGLAGFLRRRQLGARLGGPSLPLDIGISESIPASIRNAVILRISTANGQVGVISPRGRARSTTSGTRRTAARPAPKTASCCASTTTRWSFTGGAGRWS